MRQGWVAGEPFPGGGPGAPWVTEAGGLSGAPRPGAGRPAGGARAPRHAAGARGAGAVGGPGTPVLFGTAGAELRRLEGSRSTKASSARSS